MVNGQLVDLSSDSVPEILESKAKELISDHGWSINSTNLSSFPSKWLNPLGQELIVVIACSFNDFLDNRYGSGWLICWSYNKNFRLESCGNNNTILNDCVTVSSSFKDWSSKINSSGSELLSLFSLDLFD